MCVTRSCSDFSRLSGVMDVSHAGQVRWSALNRIPIALSQLEVLVTYRIATLMPIASNLCSVGVKLGITISYNYYFLSGIRPPSRLI